MSIEIALDRDTRATSNVDPKCLGCHTAVLAQSGSGKSFMVGRLIEELLIKTKARIVILDPNSDFVRLGEKDPKVWKDSKLKPWFFPGESAKKFKSQWASVEAVILSNRNLPRARALRINWGGLSDRERADVMNLDPTMQPELYWSLVLAGAVAEGRWTDDDATYDFEFFRTVADEVCDYLLGADGAEDINQHALAKSLRALGTTVGLRFRELVSSLETYEIWRGVGDEDQDIADIIALQPECPSVIVIDLLSVDTEAERVALTTRTLSTLWKAARAGYHEALRDIDEPDCRVPTILVIDEAHNIVPAVRASAAAERLAADVVRIAAEGRKFGLFLLVVTQRPRKLDANILSECDGLFLMKMTNDSDLEYAKEVFGFLPPAVLGQAKSLKVGEVFLLGRLGGTTTIWHVAPRRTMQGGRSLDDKFWTSPYLIAT
jgi:DNA helicase HerA-like ATPase